MGKMGLLLAVTFATGLLRADLTLPRRSRPADDVIVRAAEAKPSEVYAAEELIIRF